MITLEEIARETGNDIDRQVIDEFRKSSWLLDNLMWHPAAAQTGGGSWDYRYNRQTTQAQAGFRAIGSDYTPSETVSKMHTVSCAILGGRFEVDRAVAGLANGEVVAREMAQKVKGARALFADTVINGDTANNALAFDGLNVALAGTTTEINAGDATATPSLVSDFTGITSQQRGFEVMAQLDLLLSHIDDPAGLVILGNRSSIYAIQQAARVTALLDSSLDGFGRRVQTYNGIPLVDLGYAMGSFDPVVPIDANGLTSIYAVRLDEEGLHGVAPAGYPLVTSYLPLFNNGDTQPVKSGSVEMIATIALKSTRAAAVLRNVKVNAAYAGAAADAGTAPDAGVTGQTAADVAAPIA